MATTMETQLVTKSADQLSDLLGRPLRVLAVIPGADEGSSFVFARRQVASLKNLGLWIHTFYLQSRTMPISTIRETLRLRKALTKFQPDLVHAHYGTVTSFVSAIVTRNPLVVTFRGSDLNGDPGLGPWRARLGVFLSQISALRAQAIICTSEQLKSRLWWRGERVAVVPSCVDLDLFIPNGREQARSKLAMSSSDRIVLFNASKNPILKGVSLAKQAIEYAENLAGKIRFVQLDGAVTPEEMPLYINAADCLVLTSRREGSPNIVKEAMACNLPVVSVDVGDVAQLLAGVSHSYLVPRDAAAIGKAIAEVLRTRQRSNGRNKVKCLSENDISCKIIDIYRSILCKLLLIEL